MRNAWPKLKGLVRRGSALRFQFGAPWLPVAIPLPRQFAMVVSTHPHRNWRRIASPRRLTILFWLYIAQAVAGSAVGFAAPFLYFFGVL